MSKALPKEITEFVDHKKYQELLQLALSHAKAGGATNAEVGVAASIGLNVTVRQQSVETIEFNRDKAVGITVYKGHQKGSVSSNDLSKESITKAVEHALAIADVTEADPFNGLANADEMAATIENLDLYHPWEISADDAIDIATVCEKAALDHSPLIQNSDGASLHSGQGYHYYANSHGFIGHYPSSSHSLSCVVIANDKDKMERNYEYTVSREADKLVDSKEIGRMAAEQTIARLGAKSIPTTKVPVLFKADVARSLFGHFISGVSGGALYRKASFLLDSLDKQIFNSLVSLQEQPHLKKALGSAPFDGDGVATQDRILVDQGVVKGYVLSSYSARKLDMKNTGNAGGVHNLRVTPGEKSFDELLIHMGTGLLVTQLMGQGTNMVTGDYSRGASGFWVENGKIQFPVHEITIASNLSQMFQGIVALGNDVEKRGNILAPSVLIESMMVAGA